MKILLVIDVQNDFIGGALANKDAQAAMSAIKNKITKRRMEGYQVIFTRDTHDDNYLNTLEGKYLPYPHCIKLTDGWQIAKDLYTISDYIIDKSRFGCQDIATRIRDIVSLFADNNEIEEIELIGFCTDICVVSNALLLKADLNLDNTVISCDSKCCAGTSKEAHIAALTVMKSCQVEIY